jgi:hypothetical protein
MGPIESNTLRLEPWSNPMIVCSRWLVAPDSAFDAIAPRLPPALRWLRRRRFAAEPGR